MTKEEIRAVSIAQLQLSEDAVVYDVGAGTGSVSVEAARSSDRIRVYAIEKKNGGSTADPGEQKEVQKPTGSALWRAQRRKHCRELEAPTHVCS